MTHQEKQLRAIKKIIAPLCTLDIDIDWYCKEILTALRKLEPERLEVEIEKYEPEFEWHRLCWNVNLLKNGFNEEQEALDFCKRYNLQIAKASK